MVGSQQKHYRYKAAFYLIFLLAVTGCTKSTPYTMIDLHFKTADQIKSVLEFLLDDTKDINFSYKSILIPSDTDNLSYILKTIEEIDKPPTAYIINLLPKKHSHHYSTNNKTEAIHLIEGLVTTTSINQYTVNISIQRATAQSSIIQLIAITNDHRQPSIALQENWIVRHNENVYPQDTLFPNGFKLEISTTH